MRTLKKFFNFKFFFVCLVSLGLYSCSHNPESGKTDEWMSPSGKVKVLSTTRFIDDLVARVGGERVDHIALIIGELDPHSYELVKGDHEKIAQADVLFFNGLGLEHGASIRYQIEHHPHSVSIGDTIAAKYPQAVVSQKGQIDPHIWMDVSLWIAGVDIVMETLAAKDPAGKEIYDSNGKALKKELEELDAFLLNSMAQIPEAKRYLVTSHDAFNYFAKRYLSNQEDDWHMRFRAPEGLAPEGQLSSSDIQQILEHLDSYRISTIFPESNVSRDSLLKIVSCCRQKKLDVNIATDVLYADAMGSPESDADDYIKMMHHNLNVLLHAWQ